MARRQRSSSQAAPASPSPRKIAKLRHQSSTYSLAMSRALPSAARRLSLTALEDDESRRLATAAQSTSFRAVSAPSQPARARTPHESSSRTAYDSDKVIHDQSAATIGQMQETDPCPIIDKDRRPFPIMDLPTEIRLEIYRACLTRPYNIVLAKREHLTEDKGNFDQDAPRELTPSAVGDEEGAHRDSTLTASHQTNTLSTTDWDPATTQLAPMQPSIVTTSNAFDGTFPLSSASQTSRNSQASPYVASLNRDGAAYPHPSASMNNDPLLINLLRTNSTIYKEARSVLYSENVFTLNLYSTMNTVACLHQQSRRLIKHVELEIPTFNEILERFQETVRLSLRYCSGLKKLVIDMPFTLPGPDGTGAVGNTTVYANGFDILRWLPQKCDVVLQGNVPTEIETVVRKHLDLAKKLDKLSYARRQLIAHDSRITYVSTTFTPLLLP